MASVVHQNIDTLMHNNTWPMSTVLPSCPSAKSVALDGNSKSAVGFVRTCEQGGKQNRQEKVWHWETKIVNHLFLLVYHRTLRDQQILHAVHTHPLWFDQLQGVFFTLCWMLKLSLIMCHYSLTFAQQKKSVCCQSLTLTISSIERHDSEYSMACSCKFVWQSW